MWKYFAASIAAYILLIFLCRVLVMYVPNVDRYIGRHTYLRRPILLLTFPGVLILHIILFSLDASWEAAGQAKNLFKEIW